MNTIKKITILIMMILLSGSGLLFGCQSLYSKMELELDAEEVILYLNSSDAEVVEGEEVVENAYTLTATINNLPKNVSNDVLVNQSLTGIVTVEKIDKDNETNQTTFEITAIKAGTTLLTFITEEGDKQVTIPVMVIQPIEDLQTNLNYKPIVVVGQESAINTAQALKFFPSTTNQKEVVYELIEGNFETITVSESGYINVTEKYNDFITVKATSVENPNLSTTILVRVINPILQENIKLILEEEEVTNVVLASNLLKKSQALYQVNVEDSEENINVILSVNTTSNLDIEKLSSNEFLLRSIELGNATLTARVEVVGYEDYYVTKTFGVQILEYPTYVSINGIIGNYNNVEIFDQYVSSLGTPFVLKVGTIGAYNKQMVLDITEEDMEKIELRYSDGTLVDIENDILPNNITIYIKAVSDEFGEVATSASLSVISYGTIENLEPVVSTLNMLLKKGADDLFITSSESLSIQVGEEAHIEFTPYPASASLGKVNLYIINSGIIENLGPISSTEFVIRALSVGNTRITLVSSNGINKNIEVEVYALLEDVALNMYTPAESYSVAQLLKTTTEFGHSTILSATIAVGAGLSLDVIKYPTGASLVSTLYTSSNPSVATISSSGYMVGKSLGTTTILVRVGKNLDIGEGQSEIVYIERSFTLTVYMPITSTQLNYYQYELYDSNTLSYYELYKSRLQLELNINPVNASFNTNSISWTSNSNYATVNSTGLVQVSLPAEINYATVTITATIQEYNRYYSQKCVISVRKPVKVTGVSVLNVEDYLYFDARNGLGEENAQTAGFTLDSKVYPINASNATIVYKYIQNEDDSDLEPVVLITDDGMVIPNRAGNAKIHIISQDSYTSPTVYTKYAVLNVRVADGLTDLTAIELTSAQDLLDINTVEGLGLHYIISKTIDLTDVTFTPLGVVDGITYGFSGVMSGDFSLFGYDIENQIIGVNFNISNTSRNNNVGLFALLNGGTIKNLTYRMNNFTLNLSNNNTGTTSYIGGLVASSQGGIIDNVKVEYLNSSIELSTRINYIGGIVGYSDANTQIINSSIKGKFNVAKRQGIAIEPLMHIGGIAGYNAGSIEASFDVTDETILENNASFSSKLIIKTTYMQNSLNTYGGLVGYNTGSLQNIATNASVQGYYNVGGAVGKNTGTISIVLSAGFVEGVNYVGGLIGYDQGTVDNSVVLMLDKFELSAVVTPQIQAKNYVGGLIGYSEDSTISYSYAKSFYTRTIDNILYFGDVVVNIPAGSINEVYAGGLIGYVGSANITAVYSDLNMVINDENATNITVYAGGLVGANSGLLSLQNAYSKGSILASGVSYVGGVIGLAQNASTSINKVYTMTTMLGTSIEGIAGSVNLASDFANTLYLDSIAGASTYGTAVSLLDMKLQATYLSNNFGFVSLGGSPFEMDVNYNDETPFILYSDALTKMLIQAPDSLTIVVNNGIASMLEVKNNHFKIDDDKAVVYYYIGGSRALNTYSIDNTEYANTMISKTFIPTSVNVELVGYTSSNNSIARITEEGLLEVYQEGLVTITIYSILDKNVYDTFEVAIIKPITAYTLYEENLLSNSFEALSTENAPFIMKKDTLKRLYPELSATIEEEEYAFNTLANIYYTITGSVGVSFEGFDWSGGQAIVPYSEAQVLYADYASYDGANELEVFYINSTPGVPVTFGDGQYILLLDFLQQAFEVTVVEGSISLELSSYEANITLKDIYIINVSLETDTPTTSTLPNTSVIEVASVERKEGNLWVDATSEITLNEVNDYRYIEGNTIYERYEIEVTDKFNADLYNETQTYRITFASYDRSDAFGDKLAEEPTSLTSEFTLNIIPQDVYRIDMNYYAANEVFENEEGIFYNPNELPSTSIIAGKIGLLKLAVYPEFATADYIDLTYYTTQNITLSLEQVAYVYDEEEGTIGYTAIYPQSELIDGGIRLRLISNREEVGTYSYDGNLYVRLLIASGVTSATEFTLMATAYNITNEGEVEQGLTASLVLGVQPASQIQITYGGTTSEAYMAIGVDYTVTIAVSKMEIEDQNDITLTLLKNGVPTSDITIIFDRSYMINYTTYYQYKLQIAYSETFDFTKNYTIQAGIQKIVNNNIEQYKSNLFRVVPTLFTINSIRVKNAVDNYYTAAYGGEYALSVVINASYYKEDEVTKTKIEEKIQTLATQFSQAVNANVSYTFYKRLYNAQGFVDAQLVINSDAYANYWIELQSGDIYIKPKRVSEDDIIAAKIQFNYDYLNVGYVGIPTPVFEDLSLMKDGINSLNYITLTSEFNTEFYLRGQVDKPIPLYTLEDLLDMQVDGNYILMNDIVVDSTILWEPITTVIASLDGNGYTITIEAFKVDEVESAPSTKNFGLFDTISQNMMIKNVTVDLTNVVINATMYEEVYFGGIAAVNSGGIIYNSSVISQKGVNFGVRMMTSSTVNNVSTIIHIGGIVAQNSGYITNSQSEVMLESNKGLMAGIAVYNTGTIANTYYKNGYIKNTSQTKLGSAVGGFVVYNNATGKIRSSYVEGRDSLLEVISNSITGRIIGGGLEFSGDLAGFVYENQGNIQNAYANIKVTSQSRSSGFVFINSGTINNAMSMSKVAYNVAAHSPFTGTNEQAIPRTTPNSITNAYYLYGSFAVSILEPALSITETNFAIASNFNGFIFSLDALESSYGTWEFNTLTNPSNPSDKMTYPSIVSANVVASGKRILVSNEVDEETGIVDYKYEDVNDEENGIYLPGNYYNPITIKNSEEFVATLTEEGTTFTQSVRIIRDFNFIGADVSDTITVNLAGQLDGNGMTIGNINVVSGNQVTTGAIGLFRSITTTEDSVGVVKNAVLEFNEVFANDKTYVGALAGFIEDAKVYNVTIDSEDTVVQGKNLVGGIAGKVFGDSHLVNISVNISINSGFRETVSVPTPYDIYSGVNDTSLSYAGAVAGLVDVTNSGAIKYINVVGNSSIIGETVGGAFGFIGSSTVADTISVKVIKGQFFKTTKIVGGIVGENRGILTNATISHTASVQTSIDTNISNKAFGSAVSNQNTSLFAGIGRVAGGIVGFNNGGQIINAISKVDVRNSNIDIAGGLVGRSTGGSISNSSAYGSVLAKSVIGGLVGATTDGILLNGTVIKDGYLAFINTGKLTISNAKAYNNWLSIDYDAIMNGFTSGPIVIGGLVGAVQTNETSVANYFNTINKASNSYINSIYYPQSYNTTANWHLIWEYGLLKGSLDITYAESNQISDLSGNEDKPIVLAGASTTVTYYDEVGDTYPVNDNNQLAQGIKIFEITSFYS